MVMRYYEQTQNNHNGSIKRSHFRKIQNKSNIKYDILYLILSTFLSSFAIDWVFKLFVIDDVFSKETILKIP